LNGRQLPRYLPNSLLLRVFMQHIRRLRNGIFPPDMFDVQNRSFLIPGKKSAPF
jgi:hypothetical protein